MKNLVICLNDDWILQHRRDELKPLKKLVQYLSETFADKFSVSHEEFDALAFTLETADDEFSLDAFVNGIRLFFSETYSDFDNDYLTVSEGEMPEETTSTTTSQRPRPSNITESAPKRSAEEVMTEIRNLITGAEFKTFAEELYLIAPQIRQNNTTEVLRSQNYLFSIGDGCGLVHYLELLRDLLNALDLPNMDLDDEIIIGKIPPANDNRGSIEERYLQDFNHSRRDSHIVCVDISEWMNNINGVEFRAILTLLLKMRSKDVVVFAVPFVDKEVLNNIGVSLNDMVFIRKLSFPPLTADEINKFAQKEVERFGFTIEEDAFINFQRRIIQESSDGRFHGINTVNKVVREMLYAKHIENATQGISDVVIHANDSAKLCVEDFSDELTGMQMLERMVGTENIKQKVLEIISQIKLSRQNTQMGVPCLHMRFLGNPGTGKTTVARIIGKILKENGILRIGEFHEHSGRDFCGRYIGETAPKTSGICRDAYGSVLFIDEAYSLFRGGDDTKDYGREALDTLIAEMENHRNDLVVIMAGYTDDMDTLMKGNAGLLSRMPYALEFPNFTREQLFDIFCTMVNGKIECEPEVLELAKNYFLGLDADWVASKEFSNGRFVRNLFERCCAKAAMRCQLGGIDKIVITVDDFNRSISDREFLAQKKRAKIGF